MNRTEIELRLARDMEDDCTIGAGSVRKKKMCKSCGHEKRQHSVMAGCIGDQIGGCACDEFVE